MTVDEENLVKITEEGRRPIRQDLCSELVRTAAGASAEEDENAPSKLSSALIKDALEADASDIHIDPERDGGRVRFRIDGRLVDVAHLTAGAYQTLVNRFKSLCDVDPVTIFKPLDARFDHPVDDRVVNMRVELCPTLTGEKLSIRLLERHRLEEDIHKLGMSNKDIEHVQDWLGNVSGMFLVTGPTGGGKTTTLYALLHELKLMNFSVITIEDPIEYQVDGIVQMQVDEKHDLVFAEGIKAILRLDPDYMLVGEVRDAESARAAMDAAVSGRPLMSTLHSSDAVGTVTVLRNYGLRDHEIASVLSVVISQRLVRKLCPECSEKAKPDKDEKRWLGIMGLDVPGHVWHAKGCEQCRQLGYQGRTGVFEVWRLDEFDYGLILKHTDEKSIRNSLAEKQHLFLLDDALRKVEKGVTTVSEVQQMGGVGWTTAVSAKSQA